MPPDEGVDLTTAELIVCVGRGIGGAENIEIAEELAAALGAELAASRPVIDSGWVAQGRARSASPARRSTRSCTSASASPVRPSTSRACRARS